MMTFISCGHHQSRNSDDLFSGADQAQESNVADAGKSDDDSNKVAEVEAKSPELTQAVSSNDASKDNKDSASLSDTAKSDTAKTEAKADASSLANDPADAALEIPKDGEASSKIDLIPSAENTVSGDSKTNATPTDAIPTLDGKMDAPVAASSDKASIDAKSELTPQASTAPAAQLADAPTTTGVPSASELAQDAKSVAAESKTEVAPAPEAQSSEQTSSAAPVKTEKTASAVQASPKATVAPQIPKEVVWQGNQTMNRYYFLRKGDTNVSVSQLIYGNDGRAQDLKKWNSGKWSTGRMILFISSSRPEDAEMKSFYEEKGIAADSYVVQSGDWLSKISMNTYGDASSWKEIAATNQLASPDTITTGQSLKLYPANLTPSDKVAMVEGSPSDALASPSKSETVAANTVTDLADRKTLSTDTIGTNGDEGVIAPPPTPVEKAPAQAKVKAKPSSKLASPEIGNFVAQNITWLIGGAIAVMLFFLFSRRFRKSSDLEE